MLRAQRILAFFYRTERTNRKSQSPSCSGELDRSILEQVFSVSQFSLISINIALTRRVGEASLGTSIATRVLRFNSLLILSIRLQMRSRPGDREREYGKAFDEARFHPATVLRCLVGVPVNGLRQAALGRADRLPPHGASRRVVRDGRHSPGAGIGKAGGTRWGSARAYLSFHSRTWSSLIRNRIPDERSAVSWRKNRASESLLRERAAHSQYRAMSTCACPESHHHGAEITDTPCPLKPLVLV